MALHVLGTDEIQVQFLVPAPYGIYMRYWKIVEAGDYKSYAEKLYNLFKTEKHLFDVINPFWNPISQKHTRDVISRIDELSHLETLYGEINEIAVLVLSSDSSTLHIDHTVGPNAGVMARLNVPVLNCQDSVTAFFKMNDVDFNSHKTEWEGTKHWSNDIRKRLIPITQISLVNPTILRTTEPHTVFCRGYKFPRVSLTFSFKEDLVKYLVD